MIDLAGILNLLKLPDLLKGYKTYIAAVGSMALGVYQATQGDLVGGIKTFMLGLAAWGIKATIERKA